MERLADIDGCEGGVLELLGRRGLALLSLGVHADLLLGDEGHADPVQLPRRVAGVVLLLLRHARFIPLVCVQEWQRHLEPDLQREACAARTAVRGFCQDRSGPDKPDTSGFKHGTLGQLLQTIVSA